MHKDAIIRACDCCGGRIETTAKRVASGRGRYCSKLCRAKRANAKHGHNTREHGASRTHRTWAHMLQRCTNPKNDSFHLYGGRGITVCEQWRSFDAFLADMGERPEGTSLDRIDVNGNYEPANCRWATEREQKGNKRSNFMVTYQGQRICLAHLAQQLGMGTPTLRQRVLAGWPEDRWDVPSQVGPNHVSRRYGKARCL